MKLISPTFAKEQFKTKQGADIVQIAYLESTLNRLQERINTENDNFSKRLKEQRDTYQEEKIALQADLRLLEGNVQTLRDERKALMVPINTLKKEVETMHKDAQDRLESIEIQETVLENQLEEVKNKLDELSEREENIKKLETTCYLKAKGIDEESQKVSDGHTKLNGMMADFNKEVIKKTTELKEQEEKLKIEQQKAAEYLELRTKELNEIERGLVDKRQALERAYKQLNIK